ncbi:MAG: tRNA (adenosine(37)-N6)-threonylcarbamoyltransferase complex ATPase subunit type 1 TsaE [Betaproteobacteria bacterium]|nr:tRNA (adenosine(37)-N6)-threonylcarbamoyltransferase complex ATPase subunit type 1 TsaE [Betaproteobacteria bacterium]
MSPVKIERHLDNEEATHRLAAELAKALRPGLVVYLVGDLGAGKTTLVRGVLRALGYRDKVKSPTFTLVELYEVSSLYLYHFDFYRFDDPREWEDAGFRECFGPTTTCLIEWPEKVGARLPPADIRITLTIPDAGRDATIAAGTEAGEECLKQLQPSVAP